MTGTDISSASFDIGVTLATPGSARSGATSREAQPWGTKASEFSITTGPVPPCPIRCAKPRFIVPLPPWLWRLAFAVARPLLPGATAAMGHRMETDLTFDGRPAARDFGWAPRGFDPKF